MGGSDGQSPRLAFHLVSSFGYCCPGRDDIAQVHVGGRLGIPAVEAARRMLTRSVAHDFVTQWEQVNGPIRPPNDPTTHATARQRWKGAKRGRLLRSRSPTLILTFTPLLRPSLTSHFKRYRSE